MKIGKNMTNLQIAELLRSVAAAYQLKGAEKNKFKIIAYQRAGDAVEHATSELKDLWDDGKLKDVPGIGASMAEHLDEIFRTGHSKHFEAVMKGLPSSMFELMKVPGIGAKTGFRLAKELKIKNINELEKAAKTGKISKLERFGEESAKRIARSVKEVSGRTKRQLLPHATLIADDIMNWMVEDKNVKRVDPLGSLRRQASTVGDVDISVASDKPDEVLEHFTRYPKSQRTLEKGTATSSIVVPGDIQVDLMVQPPDAYGSLLQHFTGSKHHNIALREYALKKGLSLSEYGIKDLKTGKKEKIKTEEEFYQRLGLQYIPPELREDTGEIEAAKEGKIPKLVEVKDIKGDLHIHSSFDIETSHDIGDNSMEEIIEQASKLGYEYLAFSEHNPAQSTHNKKQIVEILKKKHEKVEQINYSLKKSGKNGLQKVFNSLEIDILPDGSIPVSDEGLDTLDFALVSIHSSFRGERTSMTKRVISALSHPKVKIFAHPTGRILEKREGVELNWPEIFEFCFNNDKWLEISADPARLDLPDTLVHEGVKKKIKFSIDSDSHHEDGMNNMAFGVSVARRGWATPGDIINTRSLKEFEKLLK